MAFVSMIFVFLGFAAVILGFMLLWGIIFLIAAGITKNKYRHRKFPKVFLGLGIALVTIPLAIGIFVGGTCVAEDVGSSVRRMTYSNFVEKWKNEDISENEATNDVMDTILHAVENNDRETIKNSFCDSIKDSGELDSQITKFLSDYPKGLHKNTFSSYNYVIAKDSERIKGKNLILCGYEIKTENGYMYFAVGGCRGDEDKSNVGVQYLYIRNERSCVLGEKPDESSQYISVMQNTNENIITRRVGGKPMLFDSIGNKNISEEEAIEAMKKVSSLKDFKNLYGSPNAQNDNSNEVIYELLPKDDMQLYLVICTDGFKINYSYIKDDEGTYSVWIDKNGNVKTSDDSSSE